MNEHIKLER